MEENVNETITKDEKSYTQSEVNTILKDYVHKDKVTEIVQKRLKRKNSDNEEKLNATASDLDKLKQELDSRKKELDSMSLQLECKEYLLNEGISTDMIGLIEANSIDDFKDKVSKISNIVNKQKASPSFMVNSSFRDTIRDGFFTTGRIPKNKY